MRFLVLASLMPLALLGGCAAAAHPHASAAKSSMDCPMMKEGKSAMHDAKAHAEMMKDCPMMKEQAPDSSAPPAADDAHQH